LGGVCVAGLVYKSPYEYQVFLGVMFRKGKRKKVPKEKKGKEF
jgi:hypothetical protein